ncbi:MAG TPA: hypothetical protein VIL72_04070, partial [Beijerinckiaceae bacterium]
MMVKFRLKISADVEFEFNPRQYPPGTAPDVALSWELEQAAQDPAEYLAMPGAIAEVTGAVLRDGQEGERVNRAADPVAQRLNEDTAELQRALEFIRDRAGDASAPPFQRLGMIDAQAQMALIRASVGRSLRQARAAEEAPGGRLSTGTAGQV